MFASADFNEYLWLLEKKNGDLWKGRALGTELSKQLLKTSVLTNKQYAHVEMFIKQIHGKLQTYLTWPDW